MSKKTRTEELEKLAQFGKQVLEQIKKMENPHIQIPLRSLSNTIFDEDKQILKLGNKKQVRTYFNTAHTKKFMQTLLIASA